MNNIGRLKECIEIAERHICHESASGEHTLHMCPKCKKRSCRKVHCAQCWKKQLTEDKAELRRILKEGSSEK